MLNADETLRDLQALGASTTQGGVYIEKLFEEDHHQLAYIVHESISDLAGLNDSKYSYEQHKILYLKPEGLAQVEWGNGLGTISPHMDDPYEEIETHLLGLTTCRNELGIPTEFIPLKTIIEQLDDNEIYTLLHTEAKFYSGKNVDGIKVQTRNILDFSPETGQLRFYFDARDETHNAGTDVAKRMQAVQHKDLVTKITQEILPVCPRMAIPTATGTYLVVSNEKGLHSRKALTLDDKEVEKIEKSADDMQKTPRLLYRSKGSFQEALARESLKIDGIKR